MINQVERAHLLKNLHIKGNPIFLFNIWDAGSAQVLQTVGAKVIATSSWSVAAAHGYNDGEKLPFDLALSNLTWIITAVTLPVTMDFEGGYGESPAEVQDKVAQIIEAGAVGINFEDQIVNGEALYSIEHQCARIKAIRSIAEQMSIPIFINARSDVFLKTDDHNHTEKHLEEALLRADAYAKSGADGFFVPGLRDAKYIEKLCALSPLPINIMILPDTPTPKQLAKLGVARISYGPDPYLQMMEVLKEAARNVLSIKNVQLLWNFCGI